MASGQLTGDYQGGVELASPRYHPHSWIISLAGKAVGVQAGFSRKKKQAFGTSLLKILAYWYVDIHSLLICNIFIAIYT